MNDELQRALSKAITEATGNSFEIKSAEPRTGGCINEAYVLSDGHTQFFAKLNSESALSTFEAEAEALQEISKASALRAPRPIAHSVAAHRSFLAMEAIPMGPAKQSSWETMARQLARLHQTTAERFGWHRDNVIGSTPQLNGWSDNWAAFFRERRLRPQFKLAERNGFSFERADGLLQKVDALLAGHSPKPSLLHGDLWSGNAGFLSDGTPVIFDPATYYGDRETDLAFSEFFGGFPSSFYRAYQAEWPLPEGHQKRKTLYNLYHALNHLNLFGAGYLNQTRLLLGSNLQ